MALWAGHGKPSRIHEEAAVAMQVILHSWVADPERYTEVAENLAWDCATGVHTSDYSAHSLRAGGATIAYMNKAPISIICQWLRIAAKLYLPRAALDSG